MFFLALLMAGTTGILSAQTVFLTVGINQPASLSADAGADQVLCEGESIQIGGNPSATGGTQTYGYTWTPNATLTSGTAANPTASPTGTVTYVLEVSDVNNCTDVDSIEITVSLPPAAAFSAAVDPNGLDVDFTDQTSGNNSAWTWDFGDGFLSNLQNPSHSYAQNGVYTACLTVTNADGCQDSTCMTVNAIVGLEDGLSAGFNAAPNPYNGSTLISFVLDHNEAVSLEVFDLLGHKVTTMVDDELPSGTHEYKFSAQDLGQPAGVYLIRLTAGDAQAALRVIELD